MEDGYFDGHGRTNTVLLCTECFTKAECQVLINVLANMGIVSTLKVRNRAKDTYRIRISSPGGGPINWTREKYVFWVPQNPSHISPRPWDAASTRACYALHAPEYDVQAG
jgi:hypothetical protein